MSRTFEKEDELNNLFNDICDNSYEIEQQLQEDDFLKELFPQTTSNYSTDEVSNLDSFEGNCFYLHKKLGRTPRASIKPVTNETEGNLAKFNRHKATHNKYSFDNILRKIKVLFHQFLVQFLNECIKIEFPSMNADPIKKIDGKKTQDITLSHNKILLNLTLKETLIQFMSKKYKHLKPEENESKILFLMQSNSYLNDLFNMKYHECFNALYVNSNENAVDQRFRYVLSTAPTLQKFVNDIKEDLSYRNEVYNVAKHKFLQHFQDSKLRKPKQKKANSL